MKLYRQGDVMLGEVSRPCDPLQVLPLENGRIVLAHGEVTGHSHAIDADSARFLVNEQTMRRYLEVPDLALLRHEEHSEIQLPSGFYEVIIQREYTPGEIRNVAD